MAKTIQLVEGGHLFHVDPYDDKEIDNWRVDNDYHNGPSCALCWDAWCEHCEPERLTEKCSELEEPGLFDLTDYSDTYLAWRQHD